KVAGTKALNREKAAGTNSARLKENRALDSPDTEDAAGKIHKRRKFASTEDG
ncbi:MAG: hypothetical protein MMC33_000516, partial [Icmadophila ericetorum]|nr:hypothetical protein [Icmadophila ericetorum]